MSKVRGALVGTGGLMEPDCKICNDSGYVRGKELEWHHDDFGKLVLCECRKREILEERKGKRKRTITTSQTKMDLG